MANFIPVKTGGPAAYINSDHVYQYYVEQNPTGYPTGWYVLAFVNTWGNWIVLNPTGTPFATQAEGEAALSDILPGLQ